MDVRATRTGQHIIGLARKRALGQDAVFKAIPGAGLHRMLKEEVSLDGTRRGIPVIRRTAARELRKVTTVNPMDPELSHDGRQANMATRLLAGAVEQFTGRASIGKARELVQKSVATPPLHDLLEALK
jgi:hypothetical protein